MKAEIHGVVDHDDPHGLDAMYHIPTAVARASITEFDDSAIICATRESAADYLVDSFRRSVSHRRVGL
jgi:hypothetical protein